MGYRRTGNFSEINCSSFCLPKSYSVNLFFLKFKVTQALFPDYNQTTRRKRSTKGRAPENPAEPALAPWGAHAKGEWMSDAAVLTPRVQRTRPGRRSVKTDGWEQQKPPEPEKPRVRTRAGAEAAFWGGKPHNQTAVRGRRWTLPFWRPHSILRMSTDVLTTDTLQALSWKGTCEMRPAALLATLAAHTRDSRKLRGREENKNCWKTERVHVTGLGDPRNGSKLNHM